MKKLLGMLAIMGLFLASCSNDNDDPEPDNNMNGDNMNGNTEITYVGNIRGIMTASCTGCHSDPPSQGAPMSLETYNDVRGAVETRNLLARINSATNPMPPTGLMPSSTRQLIEDWIDAGMPEN